MAVKFAAWGNHQFVIPATGAPASGYKLYTYVAGSSTLVTTFTTNVGDVQQSNPIVLNSAGFPTTGQIWITEGASIKIVFTDASDAVIKTEDRIPGINDVTATADQWLSGPSPTYISATSFSLVGDQTSTFEVGRRLKTTNSGGTIYSTITASTFGALTTVTVGNDSGTLDSGLSAVSYGVLSSLSPSVPRSVGVTVAAHATTSNIWASEQVVLTGGVVTFTNIAPAPYVGAVAWVKQNAAHVWDDGAVFDVQGGADYTAAAGDWIRVYATTVSTFDITIFKAAAVPSAAQTFLAGDVALNNTSNYFNVCNTGSIGGAGQTWLITATVVLSDTAGAAVELVRIWDTSTVFCESTAYVSAINQQICVTVTAVVTPAAAATYHLSCKGSSSTSSSALTTGAAGTANKATSITAVRLI